MNSLMIELLPAFGAPTNANFITFCWSSDGSSIFLCWDFHGNVLAFSVDSLLDVVETKRHDVEFNHRSVRQLVNSFDWAALNAKQYNCDGILPSNISIVSVQFIRFLVDIWPKLCVWCQIDIWRERQTENESVQWCTREEEEVDEVTYFMWTTLRTQIMRGSCTTQRNSNAKCCLSHALDIYDLISWWMRINRSIHCQPHSCPPIYNSTFLTITSHYLYIHIELLQRHCPWPLVCVIPLSTAIGTLNNNLWTHGFAAVPKHVRHCVCVCDQSQMNSNCFFYCRQRVTLIFMLTPRHPQTAHPKFVCRRKPPKWKLCWKVIEVLVLQKVYEFRVLELICLFHPYPYLVNFIIEHRTSLQFRRIVCWWWPFQFCTRERVDRFNLISAEELERPEIR